MNQNNFRRLKIYLPYVLRSFDLFVFWMVFDRFICVKNNEMSIIYSCIEYIAVLSFHEKFCLKPNTFL